MIKSNKIDLHKLFPNKNSYLRELNELNNNLKDMDDEYFASIDNYNFSQDVAPCGFLRIHQIKNLKIRNAIDQVLEINSKEYTKMKEAFDGKDIIILDDSIAFGKTIKSAVTLIREQFFPKSITILTLFSRKQNYA